MTRVIAIIPARGGSKGIPNKNLQRLNGVPLVARAVRAANASSLVDQVYVSSDSPEILEVAERFGATASVRSADISGPIASSEDAIVATVLQQNEASDDLVVVFLQCTSPFTSALDIDEVVSPVLEGRCDSSFSALPSHGFLWKISDGTGVGINHDQTQPRKMRQHLEPEYLESGAVYCFSWQKFSQSKNRFCGRTLPVALDGFPLEIDDVSQLEIAGLLAGHFDRINARGLINLSRVKALVTDFDGVHTDDKVTLTENGQESVRCSRRDGLGIEMLRNLSIPTLILSKETNSVVAARAAKLKSECIHQTDDKVAALEKWLPSNQLTWEEIFYIGNDLNDLECMKLAGCSACPIDAVEEVKREADLIVHCRGGNGVVREICDLLIADRS